MRNPAADPTAAYSYDDAGRRVGIALPNGLGSSWGYDGAGRLVSVSNGVSSFGYTLDAVGNRIAMGQTHAGKTHAISYGYDNLYRLIREERRESKDKGKGDDGIVSKQRFSYDGVGNRLSRSGFNVTGRDETVHEVYSYNANNQLVSMWSPHTKATTYAYDSAGNMTKATRGSAVCKYGFDYRNRMTSYDGPEGGLSPGEHVHDRGRAGEDGEGYGPSDEEEDADAEEAADGKKKDDKDDDAEQVHVAYTFYPHHWARHKKTVGEGEDAVATKFLYDGDNVVCEYDKDDENLVNYVTPFLDQNLSMTILEGQDDPGTYWYGADGLGSIRNITDDTAAVRNIYDYEAFGQTFAPGTSEIVANPYTFTARRRDPEAELMHHRNRQYVSSIGRFASRDPIDYADGTNLYAAYFPPGRIDPFGLETWAQIVDRISRGEVYADLPWCPSENVKRCHKTGEFDVIRRIGIEVGIRQQPVSETVKLPTGYAWFQCYCYYFLKRLYICSEPPCACVMPEEATLISREFMLEVDTPAQTLLPRCQQDCPHY